MLLVSCLMVARQFCKATARQTLVAATKLPGVWWPLGGCCLLGCVFTIILGVVLVRRKRRNSHTPRTVNITGTRNVAPPPYSAAKLEETKVTSFELTPKDPSY